METGSFFEAGSLEYSASGLPLEQGTQSLSSQLVSLNAPQEILAPQIQPLFNPLIGVIDTGFDAAVVQKHNDWQLGFDWVDRDANPLIASKDTTTDSLIGIHGTAIAGQMGNASLWLGRAVSNQGGNWAASLVEFTNAALAQEKNGIANLSFEVQSPLSSQEWQALDYAASQGIMVVAAAGTPGEIGALGQASLAFDNFLTVGASDAASASGAALDLVASGEAQGFFGTSIAAANVSRAAATLWATQPNLSAASVATLLKTSATDLNAPGWDAQTGYGALNLASALQATPKVEQKSTHSWQTPSELGVVDAVSRTNPLFKVVGTKIYDPKGREFIAKGVNVNGPGFGWPGDTPGYANEIIDRWKFNSIRLNVKELDPAPWKYAENGTIDEIIDTYTDKGAVVVLEPHENTGSYFTGAQLDKLEAWWRQQADKYKDNPYVWFNTSNEPGGSSSSSSENVAKWVNQNQRIINAIRDEGADNVIVVDGHYWGQDVGEWNSSPVKESKSAILGSSSQLKDPDKKLVFSVHLYDQWIYGQSKMADYFDRVQDAGVPLIIGEYGAMKDGKYKEAVSSMFNTAVPREIGRMAWAWWGGDDFELTTSDNGGGQHSQYDSKGNITNLTWFGQQVLADNRRVEDLGWLKNNSTPKTSSQRIEAESMSFTNYRLESNNSASGGQLISLRGDTSLEEGTASFNFNDSGTYKVVVSYYDENDGVAQLNVQQNGTVIDAWKLDRDLGANYANHQTLTTRTIATDLRINQGDEFTLMGQETANEHARVDYIEFIPVTNSPNQMAIGEIGQITNFNHTSQTIVLKNDYVNPVVFAQPLSQNGADPAVVRINDIQSDRFSVRLEEPSNKDGVHTNESFSYIVLEAGNWKLKDGTLLEVGTLNTHANVSSSWKTINFNMDFDASPVILSQVQTNNGADFLRTRQKDAQANRFKLALEKEEGKTGYQSEQVGWLAISTGGGSWNGLNYQAGNTGNRVTDQWSTLNYDFKQAPQLLASIGTYDGSDAAGLRYRSLTNQKVQLRVEEDTSSDSETGHTTEDINFLAIAGSGVLTAKAF